MNSEGAREVGGRLAAQPAGGGHRPQPGPRADLVRAGGQGVHAGEVDDGADPLALEVEGVDVVAGALEDEAAEETERRLLRHGVLGQVGEKGPLLRRLGEDGVPQRREQVDGTVQRPHVEEDAAGQDRIGLGCLQRKAPNVRRHCDSGCRHLGLVAMTPPVQ